MVRRALRSRSLRRINVTSPGSKRSIKYLKGKSGKQICGECGSILSAPRQTRNKAKSAKKPNRPYSNLCSACMRKKIIEGI